MTRRRWAIGGVLAAVALGAAVARLPWRDAAVPAAGSPVPSVASAPAPPAPTVAPASDEPTPVAPLPPLPRSLRGTTVAGALPVDADGHLVVAGAVLELFDWFLAASGEEPLAVIRARIEAEIDARLGPPADAEARDLLDRYLAYRDAVEQMALAMGHELPLDRRFQLLRELRREHFGPDARALFGAVEERLRIELAQHRVSEDPTLSEAERAERLAALDAELPAEVRETRDAVLVASRLRAAERSLRETGAGEGEIDALRERMVGPEAAARLAALDARRADFEARLAAYRRERAQLDARAFDDAAAYADALEALRAAHFDGPERRRVDALDRLAEGDGAAVPRTPGS